MKIGITMFLYVIVYATAIVADTGISHNGGTTSGFVSIRLLAITLARTHVTVKRMRSAKLMPHFVCHIIYIISIAHRIGRAGNALCLQIALTYANATQRSNTAT